MTIEPKFSLDRPRQINHLTPDGVLAKDRIAKVQEAKSDHASVRYKGYLIAGVQRWKEYGTQLEPLKRKPILFVMLNSTAEANEVGDWLRTQYPTEFEGDKTLIIHTNKMGDVAQKDLEAARRLARDVDRPTNPVNAIVSVLMLREGWDVQNVTVVVGLRSYTARANILPEQTIGRSLRLMFRDVPIAYTERVDIIGNKAFLDFVDDLEKLEELKFDTFEVGKDKLQIVAIAPDPSRANFDIALPVLLPRLVRRKSLANEIAGLNVMALACPPLPLRPGDAVEKTFSYEGYDLLTLQKEIERQYTIPEPQTAQEVIGYYARRIAQEVKLPTEFAVLAPKVREFFEKKAFGRPIDLEDQATIRAMSTNVAHYVTVQTFKKALLALTVDEQHPELISPERGLSTTPPFPWSRPVWEGRKCVFNLVPCDNGFERAFAKFLDGAEDVKAFAKLPAVFGFAIDYADQNMNLRSYYPDFVAVDIDGVSWILETKGQESAEVERKDQAAERWCEDATRLTGRRWRYLKVPQKQFEELRPSTLVDLSIVHRQQTFGV